MKIKEIKEQAQIGLKGNFFKSIFITIFYTVITLLAQLLINKISKYLSNENLKTFLNFLILLINFALLPFSYGVISSLINIFKGKKVNYTEFIDISLLNYTKVIKLILSIILKILPYILIFVVTLILALTNFNIFLINILTSILCITSIILLFVKTLNFTFALFINYDNPDLSCKEILAKNISIIKNNKCKYLLLLLSFILWFAIIVLINGLLKYFIEDFTIINYISKFLIAIITPIITISQYIFYDNLTNENK